MPEKNNYKNNKWGGHVKIIRVTFVGPKIMCMDLLMLNTHLLRVELFISYYEVLILLLFDINKNKYSKVTNM